MKYREDIQILRGISVLFVVMFHFGFKIFENGFLGVDIFFVISGFLMAVLYNKDDVKGFLVRRANRLLPSYYTIIILTLIASYIITTPNETNQVQLQTKFASIYMSNFGFWLQNSYFSKSEFNPLLHLWSLGVEIQFYLIVPILAYIFRKNNLYLFLIIIFSMVLCFAVLNISPKTSFFLTPFRVWEFLLGYACAVFFCNNGNLRSSKYGVVGSIGLLIILLIPCLNVDGESRSMFIGHPGLYSLLIVLATCSVLIFGLPIYLFKSVFSKPFIILGRYSYSIYLVHFPVIVLFLSEPFGGTKLSFKDMDELMLVLSVVIFFSIFLHKFIEKRKFKLGIMKLSFIFIFLIFALNFILPPIKSSNLSIEQVKIFNAFNDRADYRCGKLIRILNPNNISCDISPFPSSYVDNVMLVGNSHADSIKTVFAEVASEYNMGTRFIVNNDPLMQGGLKPIDLVRDANVHGIKHIVLHFSPGSLNINNLNSLVFLADLNDIKISLIDSVPVWTEHIPKFMYENLMNSNKYLEQSKKDYNNSNADFFRKISDIKSTNFTRYPIVDYLCIDLCIYEINGNPLYFDEGHLTLSGAVKLKGLFEKVLSQD